MAQARDSLRRFKEFARSQALGGIVLFGCVLIALFCANSAVSESYIGVWQSPLIIGSHSLPIREWINEGLMAIFFLLVGLEIKREILVGDLSNVKSAALPMVAAVGGMLVPALIYLFLNAGKPTTSGWAIPMATDIAFSLGVLALLGTRAPIALKIFLTALAIVDDLGAVIVIAIFYTSQINFGALALVAGCVSLLGVLNVAKVRILLPFLLIGIVMWYLMLSSGLHATISGVLLALMIPHQLTGKDQISPLVRLEHLLGTPVNIFIVPLFALANAGIIFSSVSVTEWTSSVTLGITFGLFIGKAVGITLFTWLSIKLGIAYLPKNILWSQIIGVSFLGGIGFTMSLFISGLAFDLPTTSNSAQIGILLGSTLSAVAGTVILLRCKTSSEETG